MWIYPIYAFSLIQSFMLRYVIWISCTTLIGHYMGSAFVYMADFLLVNIYTRCKRLRNRELRVGVSGITADLAHFCA